MRLWRLRAWCEFTGSLEGVPFFELSSLAPRRQLTGTEKFGICGAGDPLFTLASKQADPSGRIRSNVVPASARQPEG